MARKKKKPPAPHRHPMREWKSPIEIKMRNALVEYASAQDAFLLEDFSTSPDVARIVNDGGHDFLVSCSAWESGEDWTVNDEYRYFGNRECDWMSRLDLYAGVEIGSYKIDLVLRSPHGAVAIECDGHEFHERTKQQASSDRARDRELLEMGLATIRFTGSDIHNYPRECALSSFRVLMAQDARGRLMVPKIGGVSHWRQYVDEAKNSSRDQGVALGFQFGSVDCDNKLRHQPNGIIFGLLSGVG